ncbi:MAG: Hsp20/alpha crystallin family protein [Acutalibacteraceae bacterium]|nr:Hsp20/alpha crystallin family protein [Oscillospiraceae bacterium]
MFGLTPYERRNNVGYYNPFKELEDFERSFFSPHAVEAFKTDIRDLGDKYILEAELPGFDKGDISIDIKDGLLTIKAEHSESNDKKDKEGNYIRRERTYGSFTRSFDVSDIKENAIDASFKNGVLELTLPKKEDKEDLVRKIEIK